jgi:hypothetical protein
MIVLNGLDVVACAVYARPNSTKTVITKVFMAASPFFLLDTE